MSEQNKELVRRAARALGDGDFDAVAHELFHPEFVNHEAAEGRSGGPAGMIETATWLRETFGNPTLDVQDIVAEGDRVVVRVLCRGTHEGVGMMRQLGVIPDRQMAG